MFGLVISHIRNLMTYVMFFPVCTQQTVQTKRLLLNQVILSWIAVLIHQIAGGWDGTVQPSHQVAGLRQHCESLGGYLTVLQTPPDHELPAWRDADARPVIEAVKRQFDPLQQLSRGRLPGVAPI